MYIVSIDKYKKKLKKNLNSYNNKSVLNNILSESKILLIIIAINLIICFLYIELMYKIDYFKFVLYLTFFIANYFVYYYIFQTLKDVTNTETIDRYKHYFINIFNKVNINKNYSEIQNQYHNIAKLINCLDKSCIQYNTLQFIIKLIYFIFCNITIFHSINILLQTLIFSKEHEGFLELANSLFNIQLEYTLFHTDNIYKVFYNQLYTVKDKKGLFYYSIIIVPTIVIFIIYFVLHIASKKEINLLYNDVLKSREMFSKNILNNIYKKEIIIMGILDILYIIYFIFWTISHMHILIPLFYIYNIINQNNKQEKHMKMVITEIIIICFYSFFILMFIYNIYNFYQLIKNFTSINYQYNILNKLLQLSYQDLENTINKCSTNPMKVLMHNNLLRIISNQNRHMTTDNQYNLYFSNQYITTSFINSEDILSYINRNNIEYMDYFKKAFNNKVYDNNIEQYYNYLKVFSRFSGGQKARVNICSILLDLDIYILNTNQKRIHLCLDNIFAALDAKSAEYFFFIIYKTCKKMKICIDIYDSTNIIQNICDKNKINYKKI